MKAIDKIEAKLALWKKYGEYNQDGYYILDYELWDYYAQRPKLYRNQKIKAWLWMLVPIAGIAGTDAIFSEMGLSIF